MNIEIDITYRCNLKCRNCNRQCYQYPSETDMTPEQIDRFVEQSKEEGVFWECVSFLGGEPLLHPGLDDFIAKVRPVCRSVRVATNGTLSRNLDLRPGDVYEDSGKTSPFPVYCPGNVAAKDLYPGHDSETYHVGCYIPGTCGYGLTAYGYYPCGIAGAIDRVFNFDVGKRHLRDLLREGAITEMFERFCPLCGWCLVKDHGYPRTSTQLYSQSWMEAIKAADEKRMTSF